MAEYFLLENMGYDGLYASKFNALPKAEEAYKEVIRKRKAWDREHPSDPSDRGLVLICGEVIASDIPEGIF